MSHSPKESVCEPELKQNASGEFCHLAFDPPLGVVLPLFVGGAVLRSMQTSTTSTGGRIW